MDEHGFAIVPLRMMLGPRDAETGLRTMTVTVDRETFRKIFAYLDPDERFSPSDQEEGPRGVELSLLLIGTGTKVVRGSAGATA